MTAFVSMAKNIWPDVYIAGNGYHAESGAEQDCGRQDTDCKSMDGQGIDKEGT